MNTEGQMTLPSLEWSKAKLYLQYRPRSWKAMKLTWHKVRGGERCQFIPTSAGSPNYPPFLSPRKNQLGWELHIDYRWDPRWVTCLFIQGLLELWQTVPFSQQILDRPSFSSDASGKTSGHISVAFTQPWGMLECCTTTVRKERPLSFILVHTLKQRSYRICVLIFLMKKWDFWNNKGPRHTWFQRGCCDGRSLCVWLS